MTRATEQTPARSCDFDRPLLLTPGEDLVGYGTSIAGRVALLAVACTSVLAVLLIFYYILREAVPHFAVLQDGAWRLDLQRVREYFTSANWRPTAETPEFGALALIVGSLYVTTVSLLVAVPVGLLAAVFLSDIVPFRARQFIKPVIEILAAIPSVAYGFFAALVVGPWLMQDVGPWLQASLGLEQNPFTSGRNILNASLLLAVMAMPTIVSVAEDALTAAGRELREGSYALGATRAETLLKVVMPAAHSGIMAAVILGMMRAIGETMLVWMAAGNSQQIPSPWWDLTDSVRTMTANMAADLREAPKGGAHYHSLFAVGAVLLGFTFLLNLAGEHFLSRSRRALQGRAPARGWRGRLNRWMITARRPWASFGRTGSSQPVEPGGQETSAQRPARARRYGVLERLTGLWERVCGPVLRPMRRTLDRLFTGLAGGAVALMVAALVLILGPILWRGSGAVIFRGTVEFREAQFAQFGRGDRAALAAEEAAVQAARQPVYEMLDAFGQGLDTSRREELTRETYSHYGDQLAQREQLPADHPLYLTEERSRELRRFGRELRRSLDDAYAATTTEEGLAALQPVLTLDAAAAGVPEDLVEPFVRLAGEYRRVLETVDLSHREQFTAELQDLRLALTKLLGPRPGDPVPALAEERYGATHGYLVERHLQAVLYKDTYVSQGEGQLLRHVVVPRQEVFAGTSLEPLFPYVRDHVDRMMRPEWTFYWRFFTDDSTPGHYFGGAAPELVGTFVLSVLAMLLSVPLGVIAAAYLVEVAKDGPVIRLIRMCINTLAGVPSIVFGLFGLAFFMLVLLPRFGVPRGASIWAGSLTLGLMVLPIVIRASEEAIKAVPRTYKEGSLALGAGRLRTFVTVTLPAALPGILTGVILSLSRAAGETAPVIGIAAIATTTQTFPRSLSEPTRTLAYSAYDMAINDITASRVPHQQFGMVMTLILLVVGLNLVAILLRSRLARKLRA